MACCITGRSLQKITSFNEDRKWGAWELAYQTKWRIQPEKKQASYERLLLGVNLRVASGSDLKMVLPDYLYECFKRRHRVVFLCRGKEEKLHWQMTLTDMLLFPNKLDLQHRLLHNKQVLLFPVRSLYSLKINTESKICCFFAKNPD